MAEGVGSTARGSRDLCQACGRPVQVRILQDYLAGKPIYACFCLTCADRYELGALIEDNERQRGKLSTGMIVLGIALAGAGAFARPMGLTATAGFGGYQQVGVAIGMFLVVLGAMFRVDTVAIFGTVLFGLAASVDLVGLGNGEGLAQGQQIAVATGLFLTGLGVGTRRWAQVRARRERSDTEASNLQL